MNWIKRLIVRHEAEKFVDNAIKESSMSPAMKAYLVSLANAGISGVAAGGFSFGVGVKWWQSLVIAVGSAAVSMVKWMAQHPIPGGAQ